MQNDLLLFVRFEMVCLWTSISSCGVKEKHLLFASSQYCWFYSASYSLFWLEQLWNVNQRKANKSIHCHFNTEIMLRLIFITVKIKTCPLTWHETHFLFALLRHSEVSTFWKPFVNFIYFAEERFMYSLGQPFWCGTRAWTWAQSSAGSAQQDFCPRPSICPRPVKL